MCHLPSRVDAGIRASGTHHAGRFVQYDGERLLDLALHGGYVRLDLPAMEIRAFIFNEEAIRRHF